MKKDKQLKDIKRRRTCKIVCVLLFLLISGTIQDMLETEMDNHLGYDRYERCGEPNYHSGTKPKTVRSKYGEF